MPSKYYYPVIKIDRKQAADNRVDLSRKKVIKILLLYSILKNIVKRLLETFILNSFDFFDLGSLPSQEAIEQTFTYLPI